MRPSTRIGPVRNAVRVPAPPVPGSVCARADPYLGSVGVWAGSPVTVSTITSLPDGTATTGGVEASKKPHFTLCGVAATVTGFNAASVPPSSVPWCAPSLLARSVPGIGHELPGARRHHGPNRGHLTGDFPARTAVAQRATLRPRVSNIKFFERPPAKNGRDRRSPGTRARARLRAGLQRAKRSHFCMKHVQDVVRVARRTPSTKPR